MAWGSEFLGDFLLVGFFLGIGTVPGVSPFGTAHVPLQPLAMMGVTLLASRLTRLPALVFWLVLLGAAVDYGLGVYLNFEMHSRIYQTSGTRDTTWNMSSSDQYGFGIMEYAKKVYDNYQFWGDWFGQFCLAEGYFRRRCGGDILRAFARARAALRRGLKGES